MFTTTTTNRNNTTSARNNRIQLAAFAGAFTIVGVACSGGAGSNGDSAGAGELGTVREVVVEETVNADGSTETITVTLGDPASLAFEPVATDVAIVAPWETPDRENCMGPEIPQPIAELDRGVAEQGGVQLAYFVAGYASNEAASGAMSALLCYHDLAAEMADDLGRQPGEAAVGSRQELSHMGGEPAEFRISRPMFGDEGPAIFSARTGATLAFLIDLDNGLDEYDGPNLVAELTEAS